MLFANHLRTAHRIVKFPRLVTGPVRTNILHRAVEADSDFVGAGAQQILHLPAMADEHVFGAPDESAVEPDRGHGVEPIGDELHVFLFQ